MRHNPKIDRFLGRLAENGVTWRLLWSTRRASGKGHDDVYCLSFSGEGFRPAVGTAIIVDYGNDGYGFYPESPINSIEFDVFRVASTRDHPLPVPSA